MRPYRHLWRPAEPPADRARNLVLFGRGRPPIDLALKAMIGPVVLRLAVQVRA
jgi:hypothetical protein